MGLFLHRPDFLLPFTLHYVLKKWTKNPLNYNSLIVTKLYDDSVKNESAIGQKTMEGGGSRFNIKCAQSVR